MGATTRTLVAAAFATWGVAACSQDAAEQAGATPLAGERAADTGLVVAQQVAIPTLNVDIGEFYIEIDDRNGSSAGNRDANLCSDAPNGTGGSVLAQPSGMGTACPDPLTGEGGVSADNPNYPGPQPTPNTLGMDESLYVDWASLDPTVHIEPFDDTDVGGADDDIFSPGACYKVDGNSPPKANFTTTGFAANEDYLYIMQLREKTQGNEEYHFFFTRKTPTLELVDGCEKWLWDVEDGDVEVVLSYPSTAGLPEAQVFINIWDGGSVDDVDGEGLIQSTDWAPAPADLAFVALNIAPGNKSVPTEDTEYGFDGVALPSGILTEVALDLQAVFGAGCGLDQYVSGISTAAQGANDDLKDILTPKNLETGAITAELDLVGSCEPGESTNHERFDYEVMVELDDGTPVPLPDTDLDVFIDYKCGDAMDFTTIQDDDGMGCVGPSGSGCEGLIDTSTFPANCTVTARVEGTGGDFPASCAADDTQLTTLYEQITAVLGAGIAAVCPASSADILDPFPFNLQIDGGSGEYSIAWSLLGDAEMNTCASTTDVSDPDTDFDLNCEFDLDTTLSCAEGSVQATVTDDVCGDSVGPLTISASRQITRIVEVGCDVTADCGLNEVCSNGFCEPAP